MIRQLKKQMVSKLPISILNKLFHLIQQLRYLKISGKYNKTKKTFDVSEQEANQLSIADLRKLQKHYPYQAEYGYSPEILDRRGKERAEQLSGLIRDKCCTTYLELGCWDGMVSFHMLKKGKSAIGIDNRDIGFDQRAIEAGVDLRKMDASKLDFYDDSFDVVFSYDAFEHFSDPESVLREMTRVTKPGGYIYLEFGPLFMSPMGLHAYREITVPYCQHLFSEATIAAFLVEERLEALDFSHCNGWSLIQFRNLFAVYSTKLSKELYVETCNYEHLNLIEEYPSIMKNKTDYFEDLMCDSIKVLFRKKK